MSKETYGFMIIAGLLLIVFAACVFGNGKLGGVF